MSKIEEPETFVENNIKYMLKDDSFVELSRKWMNESVRHKYSYNFSWMGRPIIQYPQDIVAMQEIIWETKPDLIIETGIAHGGSLLLYASLLELIGGDGQVVGLEKILYEENRKEIEKSYLMKRITIIEGDSVSKETIERVNEIAKNKKKIMLLLDSNHTHEHVLNELNAYANLVTKDSYIVIFDTIVNEVNDEFNNDRPWSKQANPMTAMREFLKGNARFVVDERISDKLQITVCPSGYLKCIK